MDDRQDITVPMPEALVDEIEKHLTYGDSRAGWIRDACRAELEREQFADADVDVDADADADAEETTDAGSQTAGC